MPSPDRTPPRAWGTCPPNPLGFIALGQPRRGLSVVLCLALAGRKGTQVTRPVCRPAEEEKTGDGPAAPCEVGLTRRSGCLPAEPYPPVSRRQRIIHPAQCKPGWSPSRVRTACEDRQGWYTLNRPPGQSPFQDQKTAPETSRSGIAPEARKRYIITPPGVVHFDSPTGGTL